MKLEQETWATEKVNEKPSSINLETIGILDLKDIFKGWRNFIEEYPGAAYNYATQHDTPFLAEDFLDKYKESKDLRFMKMSRELKRKYNLYLNRKKYKQGEERPTTIILGLYGSTKSEYYEHGGMNFKNSNHWDNQVRDFENTRDFNQA